MSKTKAAAALLAAASFACGGVALFVAQLLLRRHSYPSQCSDGSDSEDTNNDSSDSNDSNDDDGDGSHHRSIHREVSVDALFAKRQECLSAAQSVSYSNSSPLVIVRGSGQFLYDHEGTRYLDTRNNVAHVGHAHPTVAARVSSQMKLVNTNTRYLHPDRVELASRLLETFPLPLSNGKVFFVNSGSEANDLALRLAHAYTKNSKVIAVDRAYHGHTTATIRVSPYKFQHKCFTNICTEVVDTFIVPAPDTYRYGSPSADEVVQVCNQNRGQMMAMIIESGMSVAGVIFPPQGYLQTCMDEIHRENGVLICDEVQTGLGRLGSVWWAFETQNVCPDIVTIGKPFGNGVPLAAVACRADIAEAFAQGPEYFNTFGGCNVAIAAGLAVFDVLERESLREHAVSVGSYLQQRLSVLMNSEVGSLIGDVRGQGLFLGIEFVQSRITKAPAPAEASWLCSQLRLKYKILASLDGPFDNVMVIKPPMCFTFADCDLFVNALSSCLTEVRHVNVLKVTKTPT